MPQGKGTYGSKVGRPSKKRKVLHMNKGGDTSANLIKLKKSELIAIIMKSLKAGRKEEGVAVKDPRFTLKGK
jgi:hypothetical protein